MACCLLSRGIRPDLFWLLITLWSILMDTKQQCFISSDCAIGANCLMRFKDEQDAFNAYVSLSAGYDEQEDADEFGVPDSRIFFYANNGGEDDLKSLMTEGSEDFVVLGYDLLYRSN